MKAETLIRFFISVPENGMFVGVFTPRLISEDTITVALEAVSAQFLGTTIVRGQFAYVPREEGDGVAYQFGVTGALKFPAKQDRDTLQKAQDAVAKALASAGFGIFPSE